MVEFSNAKRPFLKHVIENLVVAVIVQFGQNWIYSYGFGSFLVFFNVSDQLVLELTYQTGSLLGWILLFYIRRYFLFYKS